MGAPVDESRLLCVHTFSGAVRTARLHLHLHLQHRAPHFSAAARGAQPQDQMHVGMGMDGPGDGRGSRYYGSVECRGGGGG